MRKMVVQTKYYVKKVCNFCKEKKEPDYKDVDTIKKCTTERGKILSRARSGVCAAHQKKLATSIKRARNLALLPFVPKI
jgi:small subunit ribosomal protein S18